MMAKDEHYKIVYLSGKNFDHKAKGKSGVLTISESVISIVGERNFAVGLKDSHLTVQLVRPQGFGRCIKLDSSTATFWMMVPRVNINGSFVIINFFKTGQLCQVLQTAIAQEGE